MANIQPALKDWSTTEASNQPDSTDSATIAGDLRAIQAGIREYFSQSTIASAATCDIGANDAGYLAVSGTTTITAFGTVSAGILKRLKFDGAVTVTHNGTSLILPGAANITTAAGDILWMESLGLGNWRCLGYLPATGVAVTTSNTATLTNKTINLSSNTLTGTTAQFNTALSDGDFATLAGSETLTNKTLTTPVINSAASVGGAWTAAATWTLPAFTLGGTISLNGQSFSGTCANGGIFTTIDINGGTIDGATIGGASRGAASVSSLTSTGNVLVDGAGSIGYTTGAGGSVTQATSKSTAVTLNKPVGRITMNGAALAANTVVEFTFNNSFITSSDTVEFNVIGGAATAASYLIGTRSIGAGSIVVGVRNLTAGSLSEAIDINFSVIKGATS